MFFHHNNDAVQPAKTHANDHAEAIESAFEGVTDPNNTEVSAHSKVNEETPGTTKEVNPKSYAYLRRFFPSQAAVDKLFAANHVGNYVVSDRKTGATEFEAMSIYVRLGMHLLFVDGNSLVKHKTVEDLFMKQSIRQGQVYDAEGPEVLPHIQSFVKQFNLNLDELAEPDLKSYKTFNQFFYRKLKPDARPAAGDSSNAIITSAADCRICVWNGVAKAKELWVKGKNFTIPALLDDDALATSLGPEPEVAIFRLAPQDYHRFHSPVTGTVKSLKLIKGSLYTVNPQAVNENLDVFTANSRAVMVIEDVEFGTKKGIVVLVAIGALLVGSINFSEKDPVGTRVKKNQDLGYFAYGGSTVICLFQDELMKFDDDLMENSLKGMETVVKVGEQIGVSLQ